MLRIVSKATGRNHPGFLTISSKVFCGENSTPNTRLIALICCCGSGAAGETAVVVAIGKSSTTRVQALSTRTLRNHQHKDFDARILARTTPRCQRPIWSAAALLPLFPPALAARYLKKLSTLNCLLS